jgi:hypothetical protein
MGILLLAMLIITGCRQTGVNQPEANLDIQLDVAPDALQTGEATLQIQINDAEGNPVSDATLDVRGDMTHAGMIPVIREDIRGNEEGVYTVPFEWTMGGDWIVDVTATLPDGRATTERFEFRIDGDGMNMDMNDDTDDMNMDMNDDTDDMNMDATPTPEN